MDANLYVLLYNNQMMISKFNIVGAIGPHNQLFNVVEN